MIAKLKGIIDDINEDSLIIDVNGVGYAVLASSRTLSSLKGVGEPIALYTELLIRNELPCLIGFLSVNERFCFQQLMTVQGVGARVALAILSVLSPDELSLAIYNQDKSMVARADGVGPKLAARLINELKDKKLVIGLGDVSVPTKTLKNNTSAGSVISDTLSALENLGYKRHEAAGAVQHAVDAHGASAPTAVLIKTALASLSTSIIGKNP